MPSSYRLLDLDGCRLVSTPSESCDPAWLGVDISCDLAFTEFDTIHTAAFAIWCTTFAMRADIQRKPIGFQEVMSP